MIQNTLKKQIARLPLSPGIYQFYDENRELLYVGKSVSIKKRVSSYFQKRHSLSPNRHSLSPNRHSLSPNRNLGPKTDLLVSKIKEIKYIQVFSEFEALLLEAELIRTNKPFFNIQAKDDKSPIYIKISQDLIPLISLTRKQKPKRGVAIYGPFPSVNVAKDVLRMVRRIFPYCHHKNPKKPCLYVHLGLCPYPYKSEETQNEYKETIKKIKKLLSAKNRFLIRQLTREMVLSAKLQKFEEAQLAKKQIEKLQYLTTTYHAPKEFLEQPTLVDDLSTKRLEELKKVLELEKLPRRIECYDISNISGSFATGSMVVFTNGKPDKSQYRRFKIKYTKTSDDFEMHREVMARRIKNDWPRPDLMIIDGGRGQLNAVLGIVTKYKFDTKVVSLAKRLEEIYTPDKILPIRLPKENPARQLAQAIRDEAHRFAITYHRLLRSKKFLQS
ncbi:MAG: GIY-YIG nuclease family protein [Candidatus Curtissbacteria bacterium]|nr:GIY-YIG nuclease family protein [Candidatus Curtissbacteria bacterium]